MISPRYSGPNRSGVCVCGHRWDQHHLSCIVKPSVIDEIGEYYVPDECCYYGSNEMGGLDDDGEIHCFGYIDELDDDRKQFDHRSYKETSS